MNIASVDALPDGDFGGRRGRQSIAAVQRYLGAGGKFPGPRQAAGLLRGHVHCHYSFLRSISDGSLPSPSLAEGLHLQRVLEAARAAAEPGEWVRLLQPR